MGAEIKNLAEFLKSLDQLSLDSEEYFEELMFNGAEYAVTVAKLLVRYDDGTLRQSISVVPNEEKFAYSFGTNLKYGAYHEFGTGQAVEIPAGYEDLASKFIGKGIREVTITPQPFLFPALVEARGYIKRRLETEIASGAITKRNKFFE